MAEAAIDVINNEAEGRFEAHVDGLVAYAEYRIRASGFLCPHTEVPQALEGRGTASRIVETALAFARQRGAVVMPTCPFVAGYIKRHPEFHAIVHPDYRPALGLSRDV